MRKISVTSLILASILSLFSSIGMGSGYYSEGMSDFDKVVWGSEVVDEQKSLGFGALKLLSIIEHEKVRPIYLELRKLGDVKVFAQKLEPQNPNETQTTRYTFQAWQQTGFLSRELAGTFTVDRYSILGYMDGEPDLIRVNSIMLRY